LVEEPQQWFFSSAHDRFLQDGSKVGYLCEPNRPSPQASRLRLRNGTQALRLPRLGEWVIWEE
jgi:hypothetical protein